ncbi:MAG TPA: hypothetical protein VJB94_02420 [Candidatus Nanoarchaeia archaeon]|nr:hypothetical protein [Candidatus Nanoarchaeia archaeon]
MDSDKINALSTAIIAFVTILGLAIGFYYNLKSANAKVLNIWVLELFLATIVLAFTIIIERNIKNED